MNDFTNLAETILKFGLVALRENAIMPRLVMQDFANEDAKKGKTIDFPIPRAKNAEAVTPGTAPTRQDMDMDTVPIVMDQWRQSSFGMSDRDKKEVLEQGVLPANASEALKSLCNELDSYIITQMWEKCPYTSGTVGSTPDSTSDITAIRKQMKKNLANKANRALIITSDVEENFLNLSSFTNFNESGRLEGLVEGSLGRKYGFDIASDENLDDTNITAGTHDGNEQTAATGAIGDTSIAIDTGTGTIKKGETFKFASSAQKYIATADVADTSNGTLSFFPPLKSAIGNNEAITFDYTASATINFHGMGFAPEFFGLVNRKFEAVDPGLGSIVVADQDPVTGLVLRLEITRTNKMTDWTWDMLYGGDVVRPEQGCMMIG